MLIVIRSCTLMLLAALAIGAQDTWEYTGNVVVLGTTKGYTIPIFDLPAKEWDENYVPNPIFNYDRCVAKGSSSEYCTHSLLLEKQYHHHTECANKKRALVQTEDGKNHCYAFYQFSALTSTF